MGDCKSLQGWSNLFRRRIANPPERLTDCKSAGAPNGISNSPERLTVFTHTPCFTLIEQALSVFFNVNYI